MFDWGIRGSALATVISQFVCFLLALSHFCSKKSFLRFKREAFHFDPKIVGNILSIGLAPFLMNICASMVAAFVNTAMLQFGGLGAHDIVPREQGASDLYVGAYGIVNRVALLFIMVVQGLNQGMQPIVGYNYGAKNFARVRKAVYMTIGCGVAIATAALVARRSISTRTFSQARRDSPKRKQAVIALSHMPRETTDISTFPLPQRQIVGLQIWTISSISLIHMQNKSKKQFTNVNCFLF